MASGNNINDNQGVPVGYGTPILTPDPDEMTPVGTPIILENSRSPLLNEINDSVDNLELLAFLMEQSN